MKILIIPETFAGETRDQGESLQKQIRGMMPWLDDIHGNPIYDIEWKVMDPE